MKTTRSKKVSTVFNLAADLLESGEIGWTRKVWFRKRGDKVCCCAEGAVVAACGYIPSEHLTDFTPSLNSPNKKVRRAKELLSRSKLFGGNMLYSYNDMTARSKKDVIKRLREIASKAKAQGD